MRACIGILVFGLVLLISSLSYAEYRSTISPSLTLSEEYTDNVDVDARDEESEFLTTVSPGITYALTGRHRELTLSYNPAFTYYAKRDDFEVLRSPFALNAWNQFTERLRLDVSDSFLWTEEPYTVGEPRLVRTEDPLPVEDTTVRNDRDAYYSNRFNTRLSYDFGPADQIYVSYTNGILRNDDPEEEDSTYHEPALGLIYWFTPQWGIETSVGYIRGDFSGDSQSLNEWDGSARLIRKLTPRLNGFLQYAHTYVDYEGEESPGGAEESIGQDTDYQVYSGTVGFDYSVSEVTFITASAGYFYRDESEGENESGYSLNGDMARQFKRGSIRLSGGIGYQQTFFGAENLGFTKYHRVAVNGLYEFTRRLNGTLVGSYQNNVYEDVSDREDDLYTVAAGLHYTLRPWLLLGLNYTHRTVDSTIEDNEYDENRVMLSVTFVPRPIRFD